MHQIRRGVSELCRLRGWDSIPIRALELCGLGLQKMATRTKSHSLGPNHMDTPKWGPTTYNFHLNISLVTRSLLLTYLSIYMYICVCRGVAKTKKIWAHMFNPNPPLHYMGWGVGFTPNLKLFQWSSSIELNFTLMIVMFSSEFKFSVVPKSITPWYVMHLDFDSKLHCRLVRISLL